MRNRQSSKLLVIIIITSIPFLASYASLSNELHMVFQHILCIPIILSCFWFGKKGLVYSTIIAALHSLLFTLYHPESLGHALGRMFVYFVNGLIVYHLSKNLKYHQGQIEHLNNKLKSDVERLNKAEMLSHLGSYVMDLKTGKVEWSNELFRMFGYEPGSFEPSLEKRIEMTHPADRPLVSDSIRMAIYGMKGFKIENRILRADGSLRWVLSTGYIEYDENGEKANFIGTLLDITDRKNLIRSLEEEKEKLRLTIASIGDGVISTDLHGNITIFNSVAEQLTGWSSQDAIGRPICEVLQVIDINTGEKCINPIQKVMENNSSQGLESQTIFVSKDKHDRTIAYSAAPIKDNDGNIQGAILVFRDITEEKRKQDEIFYMSYCDSLTGLYNRRYFEEELKRLDNESNLPISIIMGDANGLKITNDAFGHSEGDKLLQQVAKAIKKSCRAGDIAARWGGDEFVMILPKTKKEDAGAIVKRIKDACADMRVESLNVSIALGWDTKETQEEDLLKVIKSAEDYMYKHKVVEGENVRSNIINAVFNTLHEKNPGVESHSNRVSALSQQIGKAMALPESRIIELKVAGLLHDIGKVALNENILNKTGPLTENEWNEVKRHSDIGYRIINTSPEMSDIASYVLFHHEHYDGTGYPKGLKGEEIPLLARIITVADAYDSMTNEKTYKQVMSKDAAVNELIKGKGTQFDPHIVDVFIEKVIGCNMV